MEYIDAEGKMNFYPCGLDEEQLRAMIKSDLASYIIEAQFRYETRPHIIAQHIKSIISQYVDDKNTCPQQN
ncbi:MAG: hypothetical protein FWG90_06920 [Oscillospiraceae bacterium]|nr:hypothetical protein [Oscillospiraceae bacterium]